MKIKLPNPQSYQYAVLNVVINRTVRGLETTDIDEALSETTWVLSPDKSKLVSLTRKQVSDSLAHLAARKLLERKEIGVYVLGDNLMEKFALFKSKNLLQSYTDNLPEQIASQKPESKTEKMIEDLDHELSKMMQDFGFLLSKLEMLVDNLQQTTNAIELLEKIGVILNKE